MSESALTFREACAQSLRRRLEARGSMTLDELCASFSTWPKSRVLRAVRDEHHACRVSLRWRRGQIAEVHPVPASEDAT